VKKVIYIWTVLILVTGLLLAACPGPAPTPAPTTPEPGPKYGGVLKILYRTAIKNLGYPPELSGTTTGSDPALEKLVYFDLAGRTLPGLATAWEIAPDGKSITFTLRKGVKFHDGTDFNAAAVKYNLEARKAAKRGDLDDMVSIDIIGEYTVRLNLSKWHNALLANLATYTGYIASPTAIQKNGTEWAMANPVGTGPFVFVSWERDVAIKYKKFDGYWDKGKPYLDGIEFRFFADATTQVMAFKAGEGHVLSPLMPMDVADLKAKGYRITITPFTGPGGPMLVSDSKNPASPYADKRVRMAVDYAIDKKAICEHIFYGYYVPLLEPVCPDNPCYIPGLERGYDPGKARQLLSEAGYPKGFKTRLIARTDHDRDMVIAVHTYLREAGFDADLEIVDTGKYYEYHYGTWSNALIVSTCCPGNHPLIGFETALSPNARFAAMTLRPPEWQVLLQQALSATSYNTMIARGKQLVIVMQNEAMVNGLYATAQICALVEGVHNMDGVPLPGYVWYPADAWLSK
jgi:ABC-type transport system substrate-binding protein